MNKIFILSFVLASLTAHASDNAKIFSKLSGSRCDGNAAEINDIQANRLTDTITQNNLDVDLYLKVWKKSCDTAVAADITKEIQSHDLNPDTFFRAYNSSCDGDSNRITIDGARSVAECAAKGDLLPDSFMSVWAKTCNFDHALDVSKMANLRTQPLNLPAYFNALNNYCTGYHSILGSDDAKVVGAEAGANRMDPDTFMKVWSTTCKFDSSRAVAEGIKAGQADRDAYLTLVNDFCTQYSNELSSDQAYAVAQEVTKQNVQLSVFKDNWKSSCNFSAALRAAKMNSRRPLDTADGVRPTTHTQDRNSAK